MIFTRKLKFALLAVGFIGCQMGASHVFAEHTWANYKWEVSEVPLALDLVDNLTTVDWQSALGVARDDWHWWTFDNGGSHISVLDLTYVTSGTNFACDPVAGNVQVCNGEYGNNGWLGIAQIWTTRGRNRYIIAGVAKLNDTYYNSAYYNNIPWRQLVMCQEVAHTFGLGHQDEAFGNTNLGSCMDYTDDPDGKLYNQDDNQHPNYHDYVVLTQLYGGSDGSDGGGGEKSCNPKSPKCNQSVVLKHPGDWGQLVSRHGPKEVYERVLSNGLVVVTHVTWTIEHAEEHSHH